MKEGKSVNIQEQAKLFVQKIGHSYFLKQDAKPIFDALDENFCWNGISEHEDMQERATFIHILNDASLRLSTYEIRKESYQTILLSDHIVQVFYAIDLNKETMDDELTNLKLRLSIILHQAQDSFKIFSVHFSTRIPLSNMENHAYNSLHDITNAQLQSIIESKTKELKSMNQDLHNLYENLPGGIFRCLNDEKLTIVQMSSGFLSMFGYTREEITHDLHDSFRCLIDPRDIKEVDKEVQKQMLISDSKTLEYRVKCKNGNVIWVMDKGQLIHEDDGIDSFYCILIDTTETKEAQEQLQLSLERHKIVANQTTDIIFEWDIRKDSFVFSPNWKKKFGYSPLTSLGSTEIPSKSHLHVEDSKLFLQMLMNAKAGTVYDEQEIRIKKIDGTYNWCNTRITTQFDNNHTPVSVVGVFIDIDEQKKESEKLIEKAQRDSLTKLFNKETAQSLIQQYLHAPLEHALMIVDIDNFKLINDSMGHLFGDAFLQEVSQKLQSSVRQEDIVGRIGGDEFIILIKDISKNKDLHMKVNHIIQAFRNIKIKEIENQHISCSIGVSLYPKHGSNFNELYRNADHALYEAKKRGKNQYVICDDALHKDVELFLPYALPTEVNEKIDSDKPDEQNDVSLNKIIEYVFKILYRSIDVEAAIHSILELVGKNFDVSRVYIFENSEDDSYCVNTFEWCNEGIREEKENLQHVSYKDDLGNNYEDNFDEMDIFYCRDIKELPKDQYEILFSQNIESLLQCAIREDGKFKGFVGFDECGTSRFWTQNQINSLAFIAELVSTFLIKERIQKRLQENALGLQTILDNQNSWIYVIDTHSYKMIYINKKTLDLVPSAHIGDYCYKAFFNRDTPCEKCPVSQYHQCHDSTPIEIHNEILDIWTTASASRISWNGLDALLVSCHDITPYKK